MAARATFRTGSQEWSAGHSRDSFAADIQLVYAVTRCLEIVSEASRRLPQAMRDRHPELPWRAIMDVGNFYRHAYDNVSEDLVWRTVRERLPALVTAVEAEIDDPTGAWPSGKAG